MEQWSPLGSGRECRWMGSMSQKVAVLALTARNVSTEKENLAHNILTHFAGRLDNLAFLLKEMQRDSEVNSADYGKLEKGKQLEDEVVALNTFFTSYTKKGNLFLLSSCPFITKQVQMSSKTLGEALDSVLAKAGTTSMKLRIAQVKEAFETWSPKLDAKQQAILDSLEPEMLDSIVADPMMSTKLAKHISDSLEMPVDGELFAREVDKLKADNGGQENERGKAYALFLDQVVSMLEKAVLTKSKPAIEPNTNRSKPPIREIASGQTYERDAIERWFSEGHTRCPMGVELKNTKMKPNIALRQSIAEWRERNYDIRILNAGDKLRSGYDHEQESAVIELQRICEEDNMNKYTITSKGFLIPLIRLAEKQKFELRKITFGALRTLAEDNDENQDIMVKEGIIDIVVRCLARRYDEAEPAVLLLRVLSAKPSSAEVISHSHGAVLLLVTLLGSEREETASNVKAILENLPTSDENIVIMAEANLMKPLVTRLIEGTLASRMTMAKTLALLQMPDTSKIQTATEESISKLLEMAKSQNEEEKEAGVGALENLSSVRHVCILIAKAQPSGPEVLTPLITATRTTSLVKVGAARVLANFMTCLADNWEPEEQKNDQVDYLVCTFLQLLNPFAHPAVPTHVLRGLLGVANGSDTGPISKTLMKDREAFPLLIPFLRTVMDSEVKKNAILLFASLSSAFGAEATVALKDHSDSFPTIVDMLRKDSRADPEQIAAMTTLANLPVDDTHVTTALLQAECLPLVVKLMNCGHSAMEEAASGALLRFTSPTLGDLQLKLAKEGVVQRYVILLESSSGLTKERASKALCNFSRSSASLTRPLAPRGCFACLSPPPNECKVHKGECKVETNFCLREADAIQPLLTVVKEGEAGPSEAALQALLTMVDDNLESSDPGCILIAKAKGVPIVINMLNRGSPLSQDIAVIMLEKIFRVPQYREEYGDLAQMHVITVAQRGSSRSRQTAGRILRQLDLLHSQSHYFANSQSTA